MLFRSNVRARVADEALMDSMVGTVVWQHNATKCPDTLMQLYRGGVQIYVNNTRTLLGGLAMMERGDQAAGLELVEEYMMCGHLAMRTHIRGITVIIHPDNVTSVSRPNFNPEEVSERVKMENEMGFLHVKIGRAHV